jgi:hypothetical protein
MARKTRVDKEIEAQEQFLGCVGGCLAGIVVFAAIGFLLLAFGLDPDHWPGWATALQIVALCVVMFRVVIWRSHEEDYRKYVARRERVQAKRDEEFTQKLADRYERERGNRR